MAGIPGASNPETHAGGGKNITLSDGTKVTITGRPRSSTGRPGWEITIPKTEKGETDKADIKGDAAPTNDDIADEASSSKNGNDADSGNNKAE